MLLVAPRAFGQQMSTVDSDLELYQSQVARNRFDFIGERRRHILRTTPFDTMAVRYIEKGFKGALLDTVSVLDYFDYDRTPYTPQEQWLVLDTLYDAAKRYKSPELKLAADLMKGRLMEQDVERYEWFEQALRNARKIGDPNMEAHILTEMWARTYFDGWDGWYARSFEYAKRLETALDASDDDYPYKGLQYIWLAISYHRFKDQDKALHFFHKGLTFRDPSHLLFGNNYMQAWDFLQNYHLTQGNLDSVAYYARKEIASPESPVNYLGNTNFAISNLGRVEMKKGNYRDAVRLMEAGLENMVGNHGDWVFRAHLNNTLGECYLLMGNLEKTKYHLSRATADIHWFGEDFRQEILRDWYVLNSKYYSALGDQELSRQYIDSALVAARTFEDLTGKHIVMLGEQRLQKAEMDLKNLRIERQKNIIWSVVAGLILIAVALLFIVRLYMRRNAAYKALARRAEEWAREDRKTLYGAIVDEVPPDTPESKTTLGDAETDLNNGNGNQAIAGDITIQQDDDIAENVKIQPTAEDRRIMVLIEREMNENHAYREPGLTMEVIADRLGIRRNAVSRAGNRVTGNNFSQYVNGLRIKEAIRIISGTTHDDLRMDELYEQVGFGNYATFYRTFKQFTGLSPVEFQKQSRNIADKQ